LPPVSGVSRPTMEFVVDQTQQRLGDTQWIA
jgi:hypothetical protein